MRGYLIRIAVDQAYGGWNGPVDPVTNEFVYVPIPESRPMRAELATPYAAVSPALDDFAARHPAARRSAMTLPPELATKNMHLDPDFDQLTYGDSGTRRGRGLTSLCVGDIVVFYGGLRPVAECRHRLVYALLGLYRVAQVVRAGELDEPEWRANAHTRCQAIEPSDVIVRAAADASGRLSRCIPIGEFRDRAYRVERHILSEWGGLSCRDGYLQRSAVLPTILNPDKFLTWFERQSPVLVRANNV